MTSGGGLGNLQAETSRARVASVILTPDTRGILWRGMQISLVLDYFDIRVNGEITTLGAGNIVGRLLQFAFLPERAALQPDHARAGRKPRGPSTSRAFATPM